MSMERATPLEQVQIVPLMLHVQGQVGCLVECGHRKATKRGLLLTPSTSRRRMGSLGEEYCLITGIIKEIMHSLHR